MNFRERIEKRRENQDNLESANNNEQSESFDSDYFGVDNLRNAPACIDLRFADGNRKALPYTYIVEINFDAADGIEIRTSFKLVKITGRDLGKLYDYLTTFQVKYIQVHSGTDITDEGVFVRDIKIAEL